MLNIDYENNGRRAKIRCGRGGDILLHSIRSAIRHYNRGPVIRIKNITQNSSSMYRQQISLQLSLLPLNGSLETPASLVVSCKDDPIRHVFAKDINSSSRPWNEESYLFSLYTNESVHIELESEIVDNPITIGPLGKISDGTLGIESNLMDLRNVIPQSIKNINQIIEKWSPSESDAKIYGLRIDIQTSFERVSIPAILSILYFDPNLFSLISYYRNSETDPFILCITRKNETVKLKKTMDAFKTKRRLILAENIIS